MVYNISPLYLCCMLDLLYCMKRLIKSMNNLLAHWHIFRIFFLVFLFSILCMHLPILLNFSMQGLNYTRGVLFPYLYLSCFSFSFCTLLSLHSKHLYLSWESCTILYRSSKFLFATFFVSPQISSLSFPFHYLIFSICFLQVVHQFIYCN